MYLTQWFEPEPNIVKGLSFVKALEAAGHEVTVVTAFPNYPTGRLYPGYRLKPLAREAIEGVNIVRLPLYPSHDASSVRRSFNYLSFFASAFLYCLFRRRRYDVAYVYHPPITVGLAAALTARIRHLPFVLDVQDLWPDTIPATGMAGSRRLVGALGWMCDLVYRRASAIVAQSEGMRRKLIERGAAPEKVVAIHNWAEAEFSAPGKAPPRPRGRPFTVVYGGNFGRAQALETVIDAAVRLQANRAHIEIVLYGDGVEEAMLRERAAKAGLTILRFEPRVRRERIVEVFAAADALLLHLSDDPLFAVTIPSKMQFYLAMGRPIVAGMAGETADLLERSGAALTSPPGDAEALARAIGELAEMSAAQRKRMGAAGLGFYRERLSFAEGMARTLELLEGTNVQKGPSDRFSG